MITPSDFIDSLRNSDPYIKTIFTQGGCYQFHLVLKSIFPKCKPFINEDLEHIASLINGRMYDITGCVDHSDYWHPLASCDVDMVKDWSFSKSQMLLIRECPACDEPILA